MKKRGIILVGAMVVVALVVFVSVSHMKKKDYSTIAKNIHQEYAELPVGYFSVSYDASKDSCVQIQLAIQAQNAAAIKKEIEQKYKDDVSISLINVPDLVTIVTEEDAKRQKLRIIISNAFFGGSSLISLGDVESARTAVIPPDKDEIRQVMETIAADRPLEIPLDKSIVEAGDLVRVSYSIHNQGKTLSQLKNLPVIAGTDNVDRQIGDFVVGKEVGDSYSFDYRSKEEVYRCEIELHYIYKTESAQIDDAFAQREMGYSSVEEWYDSLYQEAYAGAREQAWQDAFQKIKSASIFSMNEDWLAKRAGEMAAATAVLAREYGVSEESFMMTQYGMTEHEFLMRQYRNCESELQEYMIIAAIADYMGILPEWMLADQDSEASAQSAGDPETVLRAYWDIREKVVAYMSGE